MHHLASNIREEDVAYEEIPGKSAEAWQHNICSEIQFRAAFFLTISLVIDITSPAGQSSTHDESQDA